MRDAMKDGMDRAAAAFMAATTWRYSAYAEGEYARVLITSDNRVAVWSSFGHFACSYGAPGACIRRHVCEAAKHGTLASYLAPVSETKASRGREAVALEAFIVKHIVPGIEAELRMEQP